MCDVCMQLGRCRSSKGGGGGGLLFPTLYTASHLFYIKSFNCPFSVLCVCDEDTDMGWGGVGVNSSSVRNWPEALPLTENTVSLPSNEIFPAFLKVMFMKVALWRNYSRKNCPAIDTVLSRSKGKPPPPFSLVIRLYVNYWWVVSGKKRVKFRSVHPRVF